MDDLKKQAEELGIDVDKRWGEARLQQEIDKALDAPTDAPEPAKAKAAPAPEKLVAVHINRDTWDTDGTRHPKGTIIEVSVETAMDGIETGALTRAKG